MYPTLLEIRACAAVAGVPAIPDTVDSSRTVQQLLDQLAGQDRELADLRGQLNGVSIRAATAEARLGRLRRWLEREYTRCASGAAEANESHRAGQAYARLRLVEELLQEFEFEAHP